MNHTTTSMTITIPNVLSFKYLRGVTIGNNFKYAHHITIIVNKAKCI